ncbi:MAG TPA: hypothetical protein VMU81_14955 [Acetobacteraceae bacterium]|nr:hypothetical protein [Acetobacteraceae bacterium]
MKKRTAAEVEGIAQAYERMIARFTPQQSTLVRQVFAGLANGELSEEEANEMLVRNLGIARTGSWRELLD